MDCYTHRNAYICNRKADETYKIKPPQALTWGGFNLVYYCPLYFCH